MSVKFYKYKVLGMIFIATLFIQSCLIGPEEELCGHEEGFDKDFAIEICSMFLSPGKRPRYADETEDEYNEKMAESKERGENICAFSMFMYLDCKKKNDGYYMRSPI